MFLVAKNTLEVLMDGSVQGTEDSTMLAGDGTGDVGRIGLGWCHCEDRDR